MKVTRNIDTGDEKQTIRTISTKPKEHFEGRWKSGRLYPLYSVVVNNGTTFISQNAKMKEEPYVIYDANKKEFKAPDGWLIKEMSADSRVTALGGGGEGGVTPDEVEEMIKDKVDKVDGKGLSTNDYDNTEKNKVASAYQKPNNGIPKSDLAKAVQDVLDDADGAYKKPVTGIPFTDLADGVQDSLSNADEAKAGLAGKQDTISDLSAIRSGAAAGATSVQPAEFNELKDEVDTIGNGAYEEAWDGDSTPVVADIPAGVVVTYSGDSYTGTLAASASTVDKIYLVSDGNGNYDRYTTVEANGAYSWKKVGSTAIPLSNYATKTQANQLEQKLRENETVSPTLQRSGYYVKTNGTRDYYSPFGIFTPIPVKAGDRIVATIDGYNSAAAPISWGATDNTNSDMSVTPLAEYTSTNHYEVTIENDGYLIVCGDKTTTPIVTIYGEMYDFEQIEVNKQNTAELVELHRVGENVIPPVGMSGYYVNADGGRAYYGIMAIFGPIQVKKGDRVSATNMLSENEAIAALAWAQSPSMTSDMSCTVLALGVSTGDATTEYEALIPDDGYLFLSANKDTTPILSVASVSPLQPIVDDVNELSEKVAGIGGALDDNKQIPVVIDKNGYFVNPSGTRGNYAPYAIFSPVSVKAGDKIIVGNIYVNSAICPLAFSTDGNTTSTMVTTPMSVFEDGKTIYSAVAPQDGYFIVSNDKTKTPTVEIAKLLDIPEIKQIGSLLSGKITMLFGDSLTAGSTVGVVAFGRVIANVLGIPYRAFVYDRFDPSPDTNAADVDIDIPSITNYGKDGTKNQLTTGRVDSVLQRVKNHITADTNVDYVLVECCVNDYTSGTKGAISAGFTGPFDENTAIGAIEETCRYLSTLGKPIRFGFYIPWQISYVPESYFNDYIPVFEKWGVPLFDMRKCAGFNMRWCTRHQELYSLPASSYANYDNTATYNLDDKVKYEGFLYKCNADGVTGIPPTNETYWTKVSEGSFDGCHLNSLGHYIVAGKIKSFIERL